MKMLAIDFGLKRFGFAIGDTTTNIALPINPLNRKTIEKDINYIKNLLNEYCINKVLIGYPLNMNGTKSKIINEVESFSEILKKKINIDINFFDERLTSFEAEEILKPFKRDYKKRKKIIDSISALLILRSYMEDK